MANVLQLRRLMAAALVLLAVASPTNESRGEDWPQFRGPNASGIASESTNPPLHFSAEENVKWSVELGKGVACPVIADGRLFAPR